MVKPTCGNSLYVSSAKKHMNAIAIIKVTPTLYRPLQLKESIWKLMKYRWDILKRF